MKESFKRIDKVRVSDQIVEQIRNMIASGQLTEGDQLPSERELASQLAVSRLPLREALKALEATHVIRSRSSDGYYVCGLETDSLVQLLNDAKKEDCDVLQDLQEARKIVEVAAVKLSCYRRTADDIRMMKESVQEMDAALKATDKQEVIADSLKFHKYMIGAAHNQVLSTMMDCISTTLHEGRAKTYDSRYQRSVREHELILQAIIERNTDLAQKLLNDHLETAYNQ